MLGNDDMIVDCQRAASSGDKLTTSRRHARHVGLDGGNLNQTVWSALNLNMVEDRRLRLKILKFYKNVYLTRASSVAEVFRRDNRKISNRNAKKKKAFA